MTIVSEQLRHPAEPFVEPTIDGPVLACIDEGRCGRAVARIAGSLARRLGTRLLLATVAQAPPRTPAGGDLTSALVRRRRELLAGAAGELDQPAETRVAFGEPAERLIALAQREGAELIVVAGPGESCTRTVLGSVYLALAGAGPCPVVVVPPGVERMRTDGPIVCDIDDSELAQITARVAADLACRLDARLKLVRSTSVRRATASGRHGAADGPEHDVAAPRLRAVATPAAKKPGYLLGEHGRSAERLADVADRESAQLLVIGSRGRGQLAAVMLGSIASKLARTATRPLVIVPPRARPSRVRHAVIFATRRLGNSPVLQVQGEIDMATAVELERHAARLLAEAGGRLVLDLSETTFADAAGARVTERLSRRTSELGGRLVLVVTMPAVRRSLDVTPSPWLAVTDSLAAAVDAVTDRPEPPSVGHLTS